MYWWCSPDKIGMATMTPDRWTQQRSKARVYRWLTRQNLFCTNCFIPRFDLGLVVQNHVQQGIMDFQFSVVIDKAQFAELVHEKAYA
jgi:hypothetical protein